jgi:hypothetical protein
MVILEKDEVTTTRRKNKVGDWIMCRGYKIQVDDELGFTKAIKITLEYVKSLIILLLTGGLGL